MSAEPGAEANFASGDMSRHVIRLSGYMILGFLAMTLSQFVEAVYLGIVGTAAIAAVTFTFPVMMALGAATRGSAWAPAPCWPEPSVPATANGLPS